MSEEEAKPEVGSSEVTNPIGNTPPLPGPDATLDQPHAETVDEPETEDKPEGS